MTEYKATPEQWADVGAFDSDTRACILELRTRIEQLETLKQDKLDRLIAQDRNDAADLAGSLVERVADAIYRNGTGDGFREEARAAIREVAFWLHAAGTWEAADVLEQEAEQ